MYNNNNPVQFEDPTGYYLFENGTPGEQNTFAKQAAALDQKVIALLAKTTDPTQRAQLEALHEDLQPGSGSWKVGFGPVDGGFARTNNTYTLGTEPNTIKSGSLRPTESIFDSGQLSRANDLIFQSAVATEGGTYEIESGRAGDSAHSAAEAFEQDRLTPGKVVTGVGALGGLANQLYVGPLGLIPDQWHP
jgi:hypothetical protein